MKTVDEDLVDLFDAVWTRFRQRMQGLSDVEWAWCPTPDERIGLRWRLAHLRALLTEDRNGRWLGVAAPRPEPAPVGSADAALAALDAAHASWREALTGADLAAPIGKAAGAYGDASRRSFVLHIADEVIHHAAEAALLRDLFAGSFR